MAILSVTASITGVLAFLGIPNLDQLRRTLFPPSASPITTPSSHVPSPDPETPTGTPFDPGSLNSIATDKTPFTEGALLPRSFTNDLAVRYRWVDGGERSCTQAYGMDQRVQDVLRSHGCTTVMTGVYLVDGTTVDDDTQILVSVQVFPMNSLSTATQVWGNFPGFRSGDGNHAWNFGIWCPRTGPGSDACTSGYATARKHQGIRYDHRYVIETTAVYTDLRPSTAAGDTEVHAAARKAVEVSGPENYPGNH